MAYMLLGTGLGARKSDDRGYTPGNVITEL